MLATTRAALLASAERRFGEDGYERAHLESIAADAGATTGALYHHFAGKQALFEAVAENVERSLLEHVAAHIAFDQNSVEPLLRAVKLSLDKLGEPNTAQIILIDAPNVFGLNRWRAVEMRYGLGVMTQMLGSYAKSSELKISSPAVTARLLLSVIIEVARIAAEAEDPERVRNEAMNLIRLLVDALG